MPGRDERSCPKSPFCKGLATCVSAPSTHPPHAKGRAAYGEQIVQTVSAQLTAEYGGFTAKVLWRMVQLAEVFPDRGIVGALSRQLG
jgi:hypothetical protein